MVENRGTSRGAQNRTRNVRPQGVSFDAGRDIDATNATIAGGDITQTENHEHKGGFQLRLGLGTLGIVILLGGGIYRVSKVLSNSDVTQQSGLAGATGTAQQIRQAELDQDPATFCRLASKNDSNTCHSVMSASFMTTSPTVKDELSQVTFGPGTGGSGMASMPVLYQGRSIGELTMEWTGSRWEIQPGEYDMLLVDGGVLHAAVESSTGTSAFGLGN